jgi:site-specific DNA-methyltransferase (adenine-specific)
VKPYYQDDAVTIYHGDCRDVLPTLGPVDVVVTDPPYAPNGNTRESNSRAGVQIGLHLAGRLVKPKGTAFVFSTSSARGLDWARASLEPLELKRLMPWVKRMSTSKVGGPWRWDTVLIGVYGKATWGPPRRAGYMESRSLRDADATSEHPLALPVGLSDWLLSPFPPGATLLDPFCGSGALLVNAGRMHHKAVGIEIEERYCEIAARRCAQEVLL